MNILPSWSHNPREETKKVPEKEENIAELIPKIWRGGQKVPKKLKVILHNSGIKPPKAAETPKGFKR